MTEKPEDIKQEKQSLKEYLQGNSALSRAYGAEQKAQVPAHLDKAVLLAANEAVKSKQPPKIAYSPFARSWYVPASMAAVLMLCVGLVFTIYKDSGQSLLMSPKSEYDIDAQIAPIESTGNFKQNESGEKSRQTEMMDTISEANKLVPASVEVIEVEEAILEKSPVSKGLLREEITEMDDTFLLGPRDKDSFERDAAKQTISDPPYLPERRDVSGHLDAADVKNQEQLDESILNNKLGEMELKESASPALSVGNKIITIPEQWLDQINDLWLSGEHQAAKESLNQFFVAYPDYPIDKMKTILGPGSALMDHIRAKFN